MTSALKVKDIARLIGVSIASLSISKESSEKEIIGIAELSKSTAQHVSFLSNRDYEPQLYTTQAGVVLVDKDFTPTQALSAILIRVAHVMGCVKKILAHYYALGKEEKVGIETPSYIAAHSTYGEGFYLGAFAYIGKHVRMGSNVKVHPHAFIGDYVSIGDDTEIYAGARIHARTQVGSRCKIHSGAVLGSTGFGYEPDKEGVFHAIRHIGILVIEDDVRIGANSTVDRGTYTETRISQGTKLDNLVHIGHNVLIKKHTVIAACVAVAGSVIIDEHCAIGGQASLTGHIHLAPYTQVGGLTGVTKSTKHHEKILGIPGKPVREFVANATAGKNIEALTKRVDYLEKKIARNGKKEPYTRKSKHA